MLIAILCFSLALNTVSGQTAYPVTYHVDNTIEAPAGERITLRVTFDIKKGWYVYAANGTNESQGLMETKVVFKLPAGFSFASKLQFPPAGFKNGTEVFQGNGVVLSRQIVIDKSVAAGIYDIEATIFFQTCSEETCLSPVSEKRKIKVVVSSSAAVGPVNNKTLDFGFTAMDGRKIDAAKLGGKLLLVHCWATWCRPCIDEFGVLKSLYSKYHSKGLEIIGISVDDQGAMERVKLLIRNHGLIWPQSFEGKGFAGNSFLVGQAIRALPAVFLIGRDGKLIKRDPKPAEMESLVSQHIKN